jgi:hypothetical protein
MEWNLYCESSETKKEAERENAGRWQRKAGQYKTKNEEALMGCGSISQRMGGHIDIMLVETADFHKRNAPILQLLSTSVYVIYLVLCAINYDRLVVENKIKFTQDLAVSTGRKYKHCSLPECNAVFPGYTMPASCPEGGDSICLWNVDTHLPRYMTSYFRENVTSPEQIS